MQLMYLQYDEHVRGKNLREENVIFNSMYLSHQ